MLVNNTIEAKAAEKAAAEKAAAEKAAAEKAAAKPAAKPTTKPTAKPIAKLTASGTDATRHEFLALAQRHEWDGVSALLRASPALVAELTPAFKDLPTDDSAALGNAFEAGLASSEFEFFEVAPKSQRSSCRWGERWTSHRLQLVHPSPTTRAPKSDF